MSLREYNRKRDFRKTAEPPGAAGAGKSQRFVVQKHAASHLHYDFRLEMAGVLKSWAVPKGIPFKKGEKKLAVEVEDHPVSYIHFEGTIPKGQYGGGTVMVWDFGDYEPVGKPDLAGGKIHFVLHGKKLQGEWHLVRMRDAKNWLLVRGGADLPVLSKKIEDVSAMSGRNMEAIGGADSGPVWESNRSHPKSSAPAKRTVAPFPDFIEPMKAKFVSHPPAGDLLYEIKFDGVRALALKNGDSARLISRNNKDLGKRFPQILQAVKTLAVGDAVFDGEVVALDNDGRSSFQLLQDYDLGRRKSTLLYYVFDLLRLDGENLQSRPLVERKKLLEKALSGSDGEIRISSSLKGDVRKLLKHAQKLGLEGLIGKQAESPYESGRRSGAWVKLKFHREQEMVIGGFTDPEGSRSQFGALLIGYYDHDQLLFAGKVGTGFNDALLKSLSRRFKPLATPACPFQNLARSRAAAAPVGLTPAEMRRCHWIKPALVCQVKYAEWTRDGKLRQPVFLGLREDKPALEVIRERPD